MRGTLVLAAIAALLSSSAAAQTPPDRASIEGGVGLSYQSGATGTTYVTYVTAPGGRTVGWVGGGAVRLGAGAMVSAEFSSTGMMRATEPSRYFTTYEEERRDRTLAVGVRYAFAPRPWVAVEPSAAIAFTFAQAWSRAVYTDPVALRPPQPRIRHVLDTGIGPAFGVDLRLGASRLALVPSVRLIRTAVSNGRYDDASTSPEVEISSIYPGGYPRWTTRADLKLRWRFGSF